MKAKFNTKCSACDKFHIKVGDEITKFGSGWGSPDCVNSRFDTIKVEQRVKYDMMDQHKFYCGVWGVPEGAIGLESYSDFYKKALELGLCTQTEIDDVRKSYGTIWFKHLAD